MNKLTQTIVGLLLCVAMVVALMPATVAAAEGPVRSEPPPITDPPGIPKPPIIIPPYTPEWCPEKGAEILQAIETAERFLEVNPDGTLTLNMPRQAIKTIGEDIYAQLQAGLTHSNEMVSQGYLKFDETFNAQVTEKFLHQARTTISLDEELTSVVSGVYAEGNTIGILTSDGGGGGVTQVTWHWWGVWIYLSDNLADAIVHGTVTMAILAGILAAIGIGTVPALVMAGFLLLMAERIDHVNEDNTGVRFRQYYPLPGSLLVAWVTMQPQ